MEHRPPGVSGSEAEIARRRFLVTGATGFALLAAGCSGTATGRRSRPTTSPPDEASTGPSRPTPSTPGTTAESTSPPRKPPWQADKGDIDPLVKVRAARVVEAIGSWRAGASGRAAAAGRLRRLGENPRLVDQAQVLLKGSPAAEIEVIEAQYGGLLSSAASVLVVCRQWWVDPAGQLSAGGSTVDVRLSQVSAGRWRVTSLHPSHPGPPVQHAPGSLAARVLHEPRIVLPPAAAADVASGQVHDSVLSAMLGLSQRYRLGISVIRSGHPIYVFGTDRRSDHPQGRAFDTFRIDGRLVVDPETPRRLVTSYMEAAASAGSYNVGGPYLLPGTGNQFFSDATHHDHVHAGFLT